MKKYFSFILIALFLALGFCFRDYFNLYYFQSDQNKITINLEATKNIGDVFACYGENCAKMDYKNGVYSNKINEENFSIYNTKNLKTIEIAAKDFSKISSAVVFTGFKTKYFEKKYFDDFIKQGNLKDFNINNYKVLTLENIDFNKTFPERLGVWVLSLFYCWYFYIFFYIFLCFLLIKNKNFFNFKIKNTKIFLLILLLGAILRLSHIDFVPLWNDELYTITEISNLGQNLFSGVLKDAGNPPLFFLLSNFWLHFFNKSVFEIRFLPFLIGLFQIYTTYFVLKKVLNEKTALLASFLCSINVFMILESNEIRSYILAMCLVLWGGYFFFKLKNDFSKKNMALYFLLCALLINTHYYAILFVLANFFLGMTIFKKENKLKFFFLNFFSGFSFLPYFIFTFLKKSLDLNFNTWLEKPSLDLLLAHVTFYFGNIIFFFLVVLFSIFVYQKFLKNKLEGKVFLYNIYSIAFVFLFALLISFFKPILFERYFCIFLPLLVVNTSIFLSIDFKTKFSPFLLCSLFLVSLNMPKYENYNLFSSIDFMANYSISDYKNIDKKYVSYFVIPDKMSYLNYYKEFKNIDKDRIIVSNFGVLENVDLLKFYLKNTKKEEHIVFYLSEICMNSKIKFSKTLNLKQINTPTVPIYKLLIN